VGVGQRAADALERAADVAVRRVSFSAAEDLLTRAVRLRRATSSTDEDAAAELQTLVRLLEVARALRYYQGAVDLDVIERAKELAERTGEADIGRALLWFEWSALATSCRIDEAAPLAQAYIAVTNADPRPEVQSEGLEVYAVSCWGRGRIAEAAEHFDRAVALVDGLPLPEDDFRLERRVVTIMFWLWTHAAVGDKPLDEVWAHFDALLAQIPDRQFLVATCGFAGTTATTIGDWERAERYADLALKADPGLQFAFWAGQCLMFAGIVAAARGETARALERFAEGRRRYTEIGGRSALSGFEASLALNLALHGDHEVAAQFASEARVELERYHERWNEPLVLLAEAAVAHGWGDADETDRLLAEDVAVIRDQGSLALLHRVRDLAERLGRPTPS
jgi:tetratricopeptide (TPR) repeat protein